ncbi:MFS transporter [Wenjunlia tyrosinilytica]|uniref:MFS transporter n=1 Tax=Wenjunlia tyrosinilytica TaxID=1544741 RepID=UPI001E28F638|nr:MFS transporter [Wenjunlia tyrosinilytica]
MPALPPAARRVVRLNNGFQLSFNLLWWMPVFYDYQRHSGLTDGQIFGIQSIYYLAFCFLEVPTGLIADRIGPRRCMHLGAGVMAAANVLPAVRADCTGFLLHFLALAAARSLVSGAGSAYLYECLDAHGAKDRYAQAEGTARALGLAAKIVCWPFVGLVMRLDHAAPYWLTAVSASASLACVLALPALPHHRPGGDAAPSGGRPGPLTSLRNALSVLRGSRVLGPLMVQGVAVFTLARICQVNLFQPLLLDKQIPVVDHGALLSAMTLAEAVGASRPGLIRRRMSDSGAVFVLSLVMAGSLGATVLADGRTTVVLLCLFAVAGGLAYPVQRHLINDAIPSIPYRATLLSLESIIDRGVCALVALAVGAYLADDRLHTLLVQSAVGTCVLLAAVGVLLRLLRRPGLQAAGTDAGEVSREALQEAPREVLQEAPPAVSVSAGGQTAGSSSPRA